MIKKALIIIISILILITALLFFVNNRQKVTGSIIQEYSHTKAVCNSSNYCQDYEITCKGNETISASPVTGAVVQFSDDWEDPRNKSDLCS